MTSMMATTKRGCASFASKLRRLVRQGKLARATYLLRERDRKYGLATWNPGFGLIPGCDPSCDVFGHPTNL